MIELFLTVTIFSMTIIILYLTKHISKLKDDLYFYKMEYLRLKNGRKDDVFERMEKGFLPIKYKKEILDGCKALKEWCNFMNNKDISSSQSS